MNLHLLDGGIIRTVVPAMLETSGNVTNTYLGDVGMSILTQKCCTKCGEWKDKNQFNKDKSRKDGLFPWCRLCSSLDKKKDYAERPEYYKARARKYELENSEKVKARKQEYRVKHIDRVLEYGKNWRQENAEKAKAIHKSWRRRFPEKIAAAVKRWRSKRPGITAIFAETRRARLLSNGGVITYQEWGELKKKYNYTCLCCGRREPEITLTLDHVKPVAKGGKNVIENAQPLCQSCNSRKNTQEIDYR